jgi:3-hydroxyisobutyrate dehydrogenase-like beta-hydroxyacid dehydrogenase
LTISASGNTKEKIMEKVGFIGVGIMGGAIATRMLQNGVPVLAYDSNPKALAKFRGLGGEIASSVRDVVDQTEIVFACLPTADICRHVALGPDGAAGGKRVKIYIETSTLGGAVALEFAAALEKFGIAYLDSPVVGGAVAAEAGTLGVLTAGPRAAFERAEFALAAFAGRLFFLGETAGMGQTGKVVNNAVGYAAFMATCEAVAVGMKAGLDMETAIAIINQGSGANFFSQRVFPNYILQGKFDGTGAMEIGVKDVNYFLEEAKRLDVPIPMASAVSALQHRVLETGAPGRDTMTMLHYFTDLAGLPRQG